MTTPKTAQQINIPQCGEIVEHSTEPWFMDEIKTLRASVEEWKRLAQKNEKLADEARIEHTAWTSAFGTTQLTHALGNNSRHSALSELMIQNAELREQLRVLQSAYDSLSQMKEKQVASRIETDELKEENANMKNDLALWAKYFDKQWPKDVHETIERLKSENARLADLLWGSRCVYCGEVLGKDQHNQDVADDLLRKHVETCSKHPLAQVKKENSRLKEDLQLWMLGDNRAMSDLLAPTIELLLKIRPTAQYQCFHAIVEDLDKELSRLRGLVEMKP